MGDTDKYGIFLVICKVGSAEAIAWYVNTSKQPDLQRDPDYKFYARRDIKADEELTADYDEYGDPVSQA